MTDSPPDGTPGRGDGAPADGPESGDGPTAVDAPGTGEDGPTFDAPWQARAFALAVALTRESDATDLTYDEFQSRLVDEIDADPERVADPDGNYYRQWLAALEELLVDRGLLDAGDLADRVAAFEAGRRDAHEFVEGDPHDHVDSLPEGHAEGAHSHGDGHSHGDDGHSH